MSLTCVCVGGGAPNFRLGNLNFILLLPNKEGLQEGGPLPANHVEQEKETRSVFWEELEFLEGPFVNAPPSLPFAPCSVLETSPS